MKTTKILLGALRVSALVAVVLAFAASAQAQVVNVSFLPHYNYTDQTDFSGLGAASDSGTVWNNVFPSYGGGTFTTAASPYATPVGNTGPIGNRVPPAPITLVNSQNVATTVGFIMTGNHYGVAVSVPTIFDSTFFEREQETAGGTQGLEITGLTAGAEYNLYLYAQNEAEGNNNGAATFTFGTTQTLTNVAGDTSGFVNGGNYVEFVSLTANGSGDISGTMTSISNNLGLNGFQIQEVAAPEPSTLATMGLLGMALLLLRKRFKKQSI